MEVGNEHTKPIDLNLLEKNVLSVKYRHHDAAHLIKSGSSLFEKSGSSSSG